MLIRCTFTEHTNKWPYIQRCTTEQENFSTIRYKIQGYRQEEDVCDRHWYEYQEALSKGEVETW